MNEFDPGTVNVLKHVIVVDLFTFCRFFFARPGKKRTYKGKELRVCISPILLYEIPK